MARPRRILNDAPSKVIEENILKERPEGLPDVDTGIVFSTHIPEMEYVEFVNGRDPGFPLDFHYHSKTHPLKHYTLYHGYKYELPVEVIQHLESCAEKDYGYRKSIHGHPEMYVKSLKYIFQCRRARRAA